MQHIKRLLIAATFALALAPLALPAASHGDEKADRVLVTVNTDRPQAQAMTMILTRQLVEQGTEVRILLCCDGGVMGTNAFDGPTLAGPDATAQQIMQGLMQAGVQVDVCAIFLPNTDFTEEDLIDGVGVATPDDVGAFMEGDTRFFSY
ncbi:hypothetical protein ACN2MM_07995 [Alkalilimnicola ehrlichii MLHE-1]|uniref:DsrE family protein n=1 Tax=Alkalilimnicola ehrlichii (strain ATCC BAA-1101 / DSM 17681 / MLHE-1) TaxID=187272 RepID=Q0A8M6_ALKEH|nr:hypothetical protein [Alkalilimnicola ehrlichii]ABI56811.1 conserved hypothetical protein [Alkalilimnicola ehrlichii MLHE-1]